MSGKLLEKFKEKESKDLPEIKAGDTVRVHYKIKEGDKERVQIAEGLVIARKHGNDLTSTITVRKVIDKVGVERIFPLHSPNIEKIEILKKGKTRKAKLYYMRDKSRREIRRKIKAH